MKVFLLLFCVATVTIAQQEELDAVQFGLNEQLAKALENLKKQMPCGFPDVGVPPLAPFKKTYLEWQYEHKLFSILANLFDLRVDGLDNFENYGVTFSILTLKGTFDINMRKLMAKGDYKMHFFPLKLLKITGSGKLDLALQDLRVKGSFQLGIKGRGLIIKKFESVVLLGDCKSNISGLLGGGWMGKLANRTIEGFLKFFIKDQQEFISETVRDKIIPMANEQLQKYSIKDILDIISKGQKPSECIPPPENQFLQLLRTYE